MWVLNLALILGLLLNPVPYNAEPINNFYTDYTATLAGIESGEYCEGNPVADKIFQSVNYDSEKMAVLGGAYILGLTGISFLPQPYNIILEKIISTGHFYGGYTWRNTGYLKYPLVFTIYRINF